MNRFSIHIIILFLLAFMISFFGCAPQSTVKQTRIDAEDLPKEKVITGIEATENDNTGVVLIKGNHLLTYTSVKQPFPVGVLLYFPETTLKNIEKIFSPESEVIDSIKTSEITEAEKSTTSRIEISLKGDFPYEVTREGTDLKIVFEKSIKTIAKAPGVTSGKKINDKALPPASVLKEVQTKKLKESVEISIKADGAIKDYKSFVIENPARIVFDVFNIKTPYKKEQSVSVKSKYVSKVRHYGYPNKVRFVLDTTKDNLSAFSASPVKDGLLITVGKKGVGPDLAVAKKVPVEDKKPVKKNDKTPIKIDDSKTAWVNRVDFTGEDAGKSTIIIGTTRPVKYDLKKISDRKLQLELINTKLPDYRKRPLITTRFESAVDRITPFQTARMKKNSMVAIELREFVPYVIKQEDNLIFISFDASSIPPKPFEAANLPSWEQVLSQVPAETEIKKSSIVEKTIKTDKTTPATFKKWTGEPIALDFYQTDIKHVLRIMKEVSGKNFAIDKDVKGSVTLSFDKPVPWDQVLDLILRMNNLGMLYEGDIIRIAQLDTISKEKKRRRSELNAMLKANQEKKDLEPLVTEYITVAYSNVKSEILPHVKGVLTKKRGRATADTRNNQIIVTDTVDRIEMVKDLIQRIDRVTPQVIIEARVVEANTRFTREVGFDWGNITIGPYTGLFGYTGTSITFDLSADNSPPGGSTGTAGFSFEKLTGIPFSIIDAKIQANESENNTKIISSPKIMTLDNKKATIKQGIDYPYEEESASGGTTIKFKKVDLQLDVTPHVTPDNRISLKISVKNNEIGEIIDGKVSVTTKEAETELLINDGDTVVIGGIYKVTRTGGESGVPGLRRIPFLGWLFKTGRTSEQKAELLIFISPRIIQLEYKGDRDSG
ncbi:MAG: type IV pilus secretin PilQ [Deltaproteobacteria bacterium]|nr:type IV pilus secretin PilQ [Deltaproteobacteria bacterium]